MRRQSRTGPLAGRRVDPVAMVALGRAMQDPAVVTLVRARHDQRQDRLRSVGVLRDEWAGGSTGECHAD